VRYVERNALRANLVAQAEAWRWSSLWRRTFGAPESRAILTRWPLPCPRSWLEQVNAPQTEDELAAVRKSLHRGSSFGTRDWQSNAAKRLGLESSLCPRGRPRKDARP